MISKFYNKNIAEGKSFLIFSIIFAILIRLAYFFHPDVPMILVEDGGYLWTPLVPFFSNQLYSILFSSISLIIIAFLVNYVNTEHAFIRRRTQLPVAIVILLFSCMPSQVLMSPYYIAAIMMLLAVNSLFKGYGATYKQSASFETSFYLVLGSLFAPALLMYIPVLWICLINMRSFSFKAFLASLFSVFIIYLPAYSYFFMTNKVSEFQKPFSSLPSIDWGHLPVLDYELESFLVLGALVLLALIVLVDNSMNSFKDKIRVRAFLFVVSIIVVFSFLCVLFLNLDTRLMLTIGLTVGSLQIAHFFSLAQQRVMSSLFFLYLLIFIAISIIPFLDL